ncbi:MAG: DUF2530 domain-containing protein [Actinomycetales bacterium]|nr:DUF2530 domain-containing protein [Actinomycetales bacterium]
MSSDRLRRSDADGILPVSIGTAVWLGVLLVLLVSWSRLEGDGTLWWIGAAVVGVLSGSLGLVFLRWRRGRMDAAASSSDQE